MTKESRAAGKTIKKHYAKQLLIGGGVAQGRGRPATGRRQFFWYGLELDYLKMRSLCESLNIDQATLLHLMVFVTEEHLASVGKL